MWLKVITSVFLFNSVYCEDKNGVISQNKTFIYNIYPYDTRINVFVNSTTEQVLDFSESSDAGRSFPTRVHVSTNDTLTTEYPLFITATQQKGVSSWELPLLVQARGRGALLLSDMSRTLCPHDAGPDINTENRPTIHLSTANPNNVSVDIKLKRFEDFYVEVNKELAATVTPSTPKYYYFSFDQHTANDSGLGGHFLNYTIPKSVILMIESDSDVCATVSIQNNSCPVFDNEKDMLYQGYHLTMMSRGGITLTQAMFPSGFYIVFIVKESDDECTGAAPPAPAPAPAPAQRAAGGGRDGRLKTFRFRVVGTISYREYVTGALVTLALAAAVVLLVLAALLPCRATCTEEITIIEEEPIVQASCSRQLADDELGAGAGEGEAPGERAAVVAVEREGSDDEEEPWTGSYSLTVKRLTRAPPDTLARRSDRYFWGALTVAIVYALPVVQLLFTYQSMVFNTGDQDLCYYNFLCAHPLGFLSDFNHVFSNAGYVLLGLAFAAHVRVRQLRLHRQQQQHPGCGIPQHYGLLYSLALALVMEGVLSACYHLCPNKMNFQFDSSFMYVMAVLVMIKLYQNRHSDVIPSAHSTFMLLAFIMAVGLIGILYPSVYFSAVFTALHLLTCFVLTMKIYYAGDFQIGLGVARRGCAALRGAGWRALVPARRTRAALLALANLANFSFAIYCAYVQNRDLARQLLGILLGNALLYTLFYMGMKLAHRERIPAHAWAYCALAHVAWLAAALLFLDSRTKWSETPAQSRRHNAACTSLQMFDTHDLWHAASAAALFLSFHMLLTIDDALANTPRDKIPTF